MNKLGLLLAVFAFTMVSCTSSTKKQADKQAEEQAVIENERTIDSHTSEMSVDWAGVYEGTMPCADCEGIETVIELRDDRTYTATYTYLGEPEDTNTFTSEGTFTFDPLGATITLKSDDQTSQYRVGENQITLMTEEGELNTGELADMYILDKKM